MCFFRKRKKAKLEAERRAEEERRLAEEKALKEKKAREEELARQKAIQLQKQEIKNVSKPVATKKPAAAKKAAPKKEVVLDVDKMEEEPAEVKNNVKSVYHVSKREKDGMWQIKYTNGRVIKLCKTKVEAMEYAKEMAANQEGTVIFHPSKGANKGKFQKAQ